MILRFTGLKGAALQKKLDKIADNVVTILNKSHSPVTPVTRALGKSIAPAALTTNSGPVINRSVKMTNPGSTSRPAFPAARPRPAPAGGGGATGAARHRRPNHPGRCR